MNRGKCILAGCVVFVLMVGFNHSAYSKSLNSHLSKTSSKEVDLKKKKANKKIKKDKKYVQKGLKQK